MGSWAIIMRLNCIIIFSLVWKYYNSKFSNSSNMEWN